MNAIIDFALDKTRMVIMALALLIVAGLWAYNAVPKEAEPDINVPFVTVGVTLEGISPEDSERLLVRPLEQQLRTVEGLKEMRATAYQGGASVVLEFNTGVDIDTALLDTRKKVDDAERDLPQDVDKPQVNEVNLSQFPVLTVTLSGPVPERTLSTLARDLKDKVTQVKTVLEVQISGAREDLVEIVIDPVKVESYGLDPAAIAQLFQRTNRLVAAGNLDTGQGRFAIKVPGVFETVEDVWNMPVKVDGDAAVRVRDVAEVRSSFKDPESFARVNGERAVALEISKRTGSNMIETIAAVREIIEKERVRWPEEIHVSYLSDRSKEVRDQLYDLQNNVVAAIVLVMVICVAAMGMRTSAFVGVAIPGSFLTAILVIYGMGLTLNIVVMFGLILSVGILVDGAIIVTEYADRKMAEGVDRKEAYRQAAKRMAWPVISSTLTTIFAFLPLMFWPGVFGEFMNYLPLTVAITLAASLLMALVFVPVMGAMFGKYEKSKNEEAEKSLMLENASPEELRALKGWTGFYVRVLDWALARPGKVALGTLGLLVGVQILYAALGSGVTFFPDVETEQASIIVQGRGNMSVYEKDALIREVEARVLPIEGLQSVYAVARATARSGAPSGNGSEVPEDTIGTLTVKFAPWGTRPPVKDILAEVRKRTADIAGITIQTREQEAGPPVGKPIVVEVASEYPELLPGAVEKLIQGFNTAGGLRDIEETRPLPGIEWQINVNRPQAAKFGLDISAVGDAVKLVTTGLKVATYRPDGTDDEVDIVLRYPEEYRGLTQMDRIRINTPSGAVPVSNFITRDPVPKIGNLNRVDGMRVLEVKADVDPGVNVAAKTEEVISFLSSQSFDPRVQFKLKGENEEQVAAQEFLGKAFLAAMFLIAIVLLTQFNSFYSAGLILTAVVMSTIGVFLGLIILGQPFNIVMTGIGVVALAGIVVNNNIVLVDTYDQLKDKIADQKHVIMLTGAQRLRPVFLTTATTALGLVPMAIGANVDFFNRSVSIGAPSTQWWAPMAVAMVFGMIFAKFLTLVFTPCMLLLRVHYREWKVRRRGESPAASFTPSTVAAAGSAGATVVPVPQRRPLSDVPDAAE
jgi:multidrug efflux pump